MQRYGKVNEHNGKIPRDHWLEDWEREAIIRFHSEHPLEGYRRLTFMMLDLNIVAVSPASTWRVLRKEGLLTRWRRGASKKGTGFHQPSAPHEHWHIDVSYINIRGTFYYLCSVLDGYSRFIIHWEIRESMTEGDVEIILQRARELFPDAKPRIISDNGPQFIAKDFKEFIRIAGMTHVRISPGYPQSNGKIERWHGSLKSECIRPEVPLCLEDARRTVGHYVGHYNEVRLHSAIGYITPRDKLQGKELEIFGERDRRLEAAREERRRRREALRRDDRSAAEAAKLPPATQAPAGTDQETQPPRRRRIDNVSRLRNDIDILAVIADLGILTKNRGRRITFRCPKCTTFHTATSAQTNLARCFPCQQNFNPIDLVMAERRVSFLEAVRYLEECSASRSARFQGSVVGPRPPSSVGQSTEEERTSALSME
jgi:putative transposase